MNIAFGSDLYPVPSYSGVIQTRKKNGFRGHVRCKILISGKKLLESGGDCSDTCRTLFLTTFSTHKKLIVVRVYFCIIDQFRYLNSSLQ